MDVYFKIKYTLKTPQESIRSELFLVLFSNTVITYEKLTGRGRAAVAARSHLSLPPPEIFPRY